MILAAAVLAYSLGAHFVYWDTPGLTVVQKGVAVGTPRVDERLILFSRDGKCSSYIRYAGRWGDREKAERFLQRKTGCRVPKNLPESRATG